MNYEKFIEYVISKGWCKKWLTENSTIEDWEYERIYADFIYDEMTVWKESNRVSVVYNDVGWGYTNYETYEFTYEEFIDWWKSIE